MSRLTLSSSQGCAAARGFGPDAAARPDAVARFGQTQIQGVRFFRPGRHLDLG